MHYNDGSQSVLRSSQRVRVYSSFMVTSKFKLFLNQRNNVLLKIVAILILIGDIFISYDR
jgi:hypothetical protein